jgi:hypothetical protein
MIGIATTIFWIFLIGFSISAAYSMKDVQFEFGEPQTGTTVDNMLFFSLPVTIINRGFYDIGGFRVATEITDADGYNITHGTTNLPLIRKNEPVTVFHNVTLNVTDMLQKGRNYLFNDTELNIFAAVGLRVAEVIPIHASTNFTFPWGAPLYNFSLGTPAYSTYNATHMRATVPISFENHAFFEMMGDIRVRMYSGTNRLIGSGQTLVQAPSGSFYSGSLDVFVSALSATPSGRFEVFFDTPLFSYGPLVIPYG